MKSILTLALIIFPIFAFSQANAKKSVKKPVINADPTPIEAPESTQQMEFYFLSAGSFDNPSATCASVGCSVKYTMGSTVGARFLWGKKRKNNWNGAFGLGLDIPRTVGAVTVVVAGSTITSTGSGQSGNIHALARYEYRWEQWAVDLGLIYALPQNTGTPGAWASMSGAGGFELGAQFFMNDKYLLHLQYRTVLYSGTTVSGTTLGTGSMNDYVLGFQYLL